MTQISGRSWSAIIEDDSVDLTGIYDKAILMLAIKQADSTVDEFEARGEEVPEALRPQIEDPDEVLQMIQEGSTPEWWPKNLPRLMLRVSCHQEGETKENLSPHNIDPNGKRDFGRAVYVTLLKTMLEGQGEPFDGTVNIKLFLKNDRSYLSGWKGQVYVGQKEKKSKKGRDGGFSDEKEEMFEYAKGEMERAHDGMHKMFANASNMLHASGAVINATRGVNPGAPWMQGDGEEPMWMALLNMVPGILANAGLVGNGGDPNAAANAAAQMLSHPVQTPGALGQYGQPRQIQGPTAGAGYNQYQNTAGQYDGYSVHEDDVLDDGFEDEDPYEHYIDVDDEDEDDEESDEYEYEEEEEEEEEEERPKKKRGSGNPLHGLSPAELEKHLASYIDENKDKKAEIQRLGMGLVKKLM